MKRTNHYGVKLCSAIGHLFGITVLFLPFFSTISSRKILKLSARHQELGSIENLENLFTIFFTYLSSSNHFLQKCT